MIKWIILILIAFLLGWLFPIEGPFDYVYDEHAYMPAKHVKGVARPKPKKIILNIDEYEEQQEYWIIPIIGE